MKKCLRLLFCLLISFSWVNAYALCKQGDAPEMVSPIKDWEIIATNVATISTAEHFKGEALSYTVVAKPKNIHNKVSINAKTGQIRVKAEAKDQFDILVKAKNSCGSVLAKFNVIVDEEE
ncbi:MAG: hypothetical protein ABI597_05575 [Gammaproteobacteria bacterium]